MLDSGRVTGSDKHTSTHTHTHTQTLHHHHHHHHHLLLSPLWTQGVNKTSPSDTISGHLLNFTPASYLIPLFVILFMSKHVSLQSVWF
jgi:hypothetical protein